MVYLPEDIRPYFEALCHGLEGLLPTKRVENKAFLLSLYEGLELEPRLTEPDRKHLKVIMAMAERVAFPPIHDVKTYCEAEAYLRQVCPQFSKKRIRLALEWALFLLARHGRVKGSLESLRVWLSVWRLVQVFKSIEQGFMSDFIGWMVQTGLSPQSIWGIIRETRKFKAWMEMNHIASIGHIGNLELQRYLLSRACNYKIASKQKFLGNLRTLFHYYKEAIDGGFIIPDYMLATARLVGVNVSANREEIDCLWTALEDGQLPAMAALMLVFVMGYGLPLKALPLLELSWELGCLTYTERLPCRQGELERLIRLDLSLPWLAAYWQAYMGDREAEGYPYLFVSSYGQRRKRPVSVDYCQRYVQAAVQSILGYPIPVNQMERGAIKAMANGCTVTEFMAKTEDIPRTKRTRLMAWLASRQSGAFGS